MKIQSDLLKTATFYEIIKSGCFSICLAKTEIDIKGKLYD